ncbi:MAG TPA: transcriptional repressor [Terriglobia bacterium]|nr:transcriptional repressor [Terriglobia bacterium]
MRIAGRELERRVAFFRDRCARQGLALTHQRMVIYRALAMSDEHPTPEWVFEQVRREIPSISLATVYKNIRIFLDAGLLREVEMFGQSMRVDANVDDHHHLICRHCRSIRDVARTDLEPVRWKKGSRRGFRIERYNVNFLGLCDKCAPKQNVLTPH